MPSNIWWILSTGSAVLCIAYLENVYRTGRYDSWFEALPYIAVPMLLSQGALFYMFRLAPTFLLGWAAFTVLNALVRLVNAELVNEPPSFLQLAGVSLMLGGAFMVKGN